MHRRLAGLLVVLLVGIGGLGVTSGTPATTPPPSSLGGAANGTLIFHVAPASATVELNGSNVPLDGSGTATVNLPPGTYAVSVTAHGYGPFLGNVTVNSSQTEYLTVHLVASPSSSGGNGLFRLASWNLVVVATVAGAVVAVALALYLWRRPKSAPEPPRGATSDPPKRDEGPD